jgi:hypothetical protein
MGGDESSDRVNRFERKCPNAEHFLSHASDTEQSIYAYALHMKNLLTIFETSLYFKMTVKETNTYGETTKRVCDDLKTTVF